ncbi:MAG: hypothetical protein NC489_08395 [Ruminococcus flavefaciens]|nr:hypothetical protein [Ruminococcus flavefaciens]
MSTLKQKIQTAINTKHAIRDAITRKGQSITDTTKFSEYPGLIDKIETGIDTSDGTATANSVLNGVVCYSKGQRITGKIPSRTSSNIIVDGGSLTVPQGFYQMSTTKNVAYATQATPSISVDSSGKITASATQSAGYVSAGTKSATQQLATEATKTVTPGTALQTAVASGKYTTGPIYVQGDANLKPENIKAGVSIFGVAGTMSRVELGGGYVYNSGGNNPITLDIDLQYPISNGDYISLMMYPQIRYSKFAQNASECTVFFEGGTRVGETAYDYACYLSKYDTLTSCQIEITSQLISSTSVRIMLYQFSTYPWMRCTYSYSLSRYA